MAEKRSVAEIPKFPNADGGERLPFIRVARNDSTIMTTGAKIRLQNGQAMLVMVNFPPEEGDRARKNKFV
jgi:hypothetical protein